MNKTLAAGLLAVCLLIPSAASAALIAEQPDNSSTRIIRTTNTIQAHAPFFIAEGNHGLGTFASIDISSTTAPTCFATSTALLKFSAKIPSGYSLSAALFHDSATPTPHGSNNLFWSDLSKCENRIFGNDVMTDYELKMSLPIPGGGIADANILDGNMYHVRFGETAGWTIETEFKTDANGNIFYQFFDDATSTPATTTPEALDPVIIIPGILGSAEHNGVWEIDPILHSYDDLIDTLDTNDYTLGVDLFTLPYDWKKSNVDTAILLKQKIDAVKAICLCDKVDLVAHSMGGLVARQYIQSAAYDQDVDQVIFLGTPHLGAPKAYLMWEGGEFGPVSDIQSSLIELVLRQQAHERGYSDLFEYANEFPVISISELLPIYDYIFDGSLLREYPNNYPANQFLENLNETKELLNSSGVSVTNIIGEIGSQSTISSINATATTLYLPKWANGYPVGFYDIFGQHGIEKGSGDGTVPYASASAIQSASTTIVSDCHVALPSLQQNLVYEVLAGSEPAAIGQGRNICNAVVAMFKILSPADFVIVAPDGKRVGKNFETGDELNEIPGAFYSGANSQDEFVSIVNPADGKYKIYTKGTDSGPYTLETNIISLATTTRASFTGQTRLGIVAEHSVNVSQDDVSAHAIIPQDQTPPLVSVFQPATTTYLHSELLPIKISASDITGVSSLSIRFDNRLIDASSTIDLFFEQLGQHALEFSAVDYVGNAATGSVKILVIATASSTQSDINRAYTNGWITSKDLRNLLLSQLNLVVRWQSVATTQPMPGNPKRVQTVTKLVKVIDTILLKLMLSELQLAKSLKQINSQGYQLLVNDINWLITHN